MGPRVEVSTLDTSSHVPVTPDPDDQRRGRGAVTSTLKVVPNQDTRFPKNSQVERVSRDGIALSALIGRNSFTGLSSRMVREGRGRSPSE